MCSSLICYLPEAALVNPWISVHCVPVFKDEITSHNAYLYILPSSFIKLSTI